MKTILDDIIEQKKQEVARLRAETSISDFIRRPLFAQKRRSLRQFILEKDFGIIAEIKRKSPSGGEILPELDPAKLALQYEEDGATGISVLTDYNYFGGSTADLEQVRNTSALPVLRKEFIIDELQLFEAKAYGADAVLLIASLLDKQQAHHLTIVAQNLGMEVVFEIHTKKELEKLNDEVDLILVNNRDLARQQTSLENSFNLAPFLPVFAPAISASGIQSAAEILALHQAGYSGALIGESVLRKGHLSELTNTLTFQP